MNEPPFTSPEEKGFRASKLTPILTFGMTGDFWMSRDPYGSTNCFPSLPQNFPIIPEVWRSKDPLKTEFLRRYLGNQRPISSKGMTGRLGLILVDLFSLRIQSPSEDGV